MLIIKSSYDDVSGMDVLQTCNQDDSLLLLNDAVLYAATDLEFIEAKVYVLDSHLEYFNLREKVHEKVNVIDMRQWVQLTEKYDKIYYA